MPGPARTRNNNPYVFSYRGDEAPGPANNNPAQAQAERGSSSEMLERINRLAHRLGTEKSKYHFNQVAFINRGQVSRSPSWHALAQLDD